MSRLARWSAHPGACAAISMALLAVAIVFNALMTRSMSTHMLLHIPLILLAGLYGGAAFSRWQTQTGHLQKIAHVWGKCNEYGMPGLVWGTLVAAYWMIPKSLDDVLVSHTMMLGKYMGLFGTGMVLFDSLRRANSVITLFFLGNFSWMMAVAGLLYQDDTTRLCNAYLLDDQASAGYGLVALAVLVPLLWLWMARNRLRRMMSK